MSKMLHFLLLFSISVIYTHAEIAFPKYPKALNEKTWDKAIDIEEVEGDEDDEAQELEESIGDLLKSVKKLYVKIKLKDFDPLVKQGLKDWNFITLAEFSDKVTANAETKPKSLRKKVSLLVKELKKAKKDWKKSDVVSKNDKKDLDNTLKAALKFSKELQIKSLTKRQKKVFEDVEKRLVQRVKTAWSGANTILENLEKAIATMTLEEYNIFIAEKVPFVQKAFALTFGEDHDLCKDFADTIVDADDDDDAKVKAQNILAVGRAVALNKTLKEAGLE